MCIQRIERSLTWTRAMCCFCFYSLGSIYLSVSCAPCNNNNNNNNNSRMGVVGCLNMYLCPEFLSGWALSSSVFLSFYLFLTYSFSHTAVKDCVNYSKIFVFHVDFFFFIFSSSFSISYFFFHFNPPILPHPHTFNVPQVHREFQFGKKWRQQQQQQQTSISFA